MREELCDYSQDRNPSQKIKEEVVAYEGESDSSDENLPWNFKGPRDSA